VGLGLGTIFQLVPFQCKSRVIWCPDPPVATSLKAISPFFSTANLFLFLIWLQYTLVFEITARDQTSRITKKWRVCFSPGTSPPQSSQVGLRR